MKQTQITRLELGKSRLLYLEAVELTELYGVPILYFDPRGEHTEASPRRRRRVDVTRPRTTWCYSF